MPEKIKTFKTFLNLLEKFSTDPNDYKDIIDDDVVFIEHPNLINKNGQIRNLNASHQGMEKAKKILSEQKYNLQSYVENEDKLVVEVIWTGKMLIDAGHLKKDQQLKAYICMIVEFKEGKIIKQTNYDCYEPF